MSKYCNHDITPVLDAAAAWKERCLLDDKSVLSDNKIWTKDNLKVLYTCFTENPDEGKRSFLDKLEDQLSDTQPAVKQIAAEMLWFMFLIIYKKSMKMETKRLQIERVWSWSGEKLDTSQTFMFASLQIGVSNPGTAYNTRRWAEFRTLIDIALSMKNKDYAERKRILSDSWLFSDWVDKVISQGRPQLRHICKFLLFPEYFERICTGNHKRQIVNSFHNKDIKPRKFNFTELDKELLVIRQEQEARYSTNKLDFYEPPLYSVWSSNKNKAIEITREDVKQAIYEVEGKGIQPGESSSTYDLIYQARRYPPKLIYALAFKHAGMSELDRSQFNGGEGTECFITLRNLGFHIETKNYVIELLDKFIAQAIEGDKLTHKDYKSTYCNLEVKASFGQGTPTFVPWVSFTGYNQTTSNGIYPVYLYYKEEEILILSYGISETNTPDFQWNNIKDEETIDDFFIKKYGHPPKKYGRSFIYKTYKIPAKFKNSGATSDLDNIIYDYELLMSTSENIPPNAGITDHNSNNDSEKHMDINPVNVIYYGPPGTGKTYISMERAVELCDGTLPVDRHEIISRYKELQDDGRISFVTFHQSYSYEDFVEGIRPVLTESGTSEASGSHDVHYECRSGVFRQISSLAGSSQVSSKSVYDFDESNINVWKMSLGDTQLQSESIIYDQCIEKNQILLGYGQGLDYTECNDKASIFYKLKEVIPDITTSDYNLTSINCFKNRIKVNDLVIVSDGNQKFRAIGRITGEYKYSEDDEYEQTREVEWLVTYDESQPYEKILNKKFSQMTLYHLSHKTLKMDAVKKLLTTKHEGSPENHVLIIDEINRGNIAKIFGELITLLEPDKRLGADNEITVTLPYSGDKFGVPNNLHIIGTMNTADRSIALLDTALRRRFEFNELMPNSNLLRGENGDGTISCEDGSKIDLRLFLSAINKRINFMLNRDQTIGHAYLMNITTFTQLTDVLIQQVIPLLQEYFYEDWHRIQLVFRDIKDGNEKNEPQIIKHNILDEVNILGYEHDEYDDGVEFSVTSSDKITPEMIRKVYES